MTEGFASTPRDFFAEGSGRARALVTFTPRGNETQRSATDRQLDRALLDFDKLRADAADRSPEGAVGDFEAYAR